MSHPPPDFASEAARRAGVKYRPRAFACHSGERRRFHSRPLLWRSGRGGFEQSR